jgi:cell division protein FtsL
MMLYLRSRTRKITLVLVTVVVLIYLANIASVSNEIWKHQPFFKANPQLLSSQDKQNSNERTKVNATGHVERIEHGMTLNLPPEYRVVHLDLKGAPPKVRIQ